MHAILFWYPMIGYQSILSAEIAWEKRSLALEECSLIKWELKANTSSHKWDLSTDLWLSLTCKLIAVLEKMFLADNFGIRIRKVLFTSHGSIHILGLGIEKLTVFPYIYIKNWVLINRCKYTVQILFYYLFFLFFYYLWCRFTYTLWGSIEHIDRSYYTQ